MSKSPEEYFLDEELSPEERGEEVAFSETERAFLEKYLGLERDILDRLGIEEAAEPQAVELSEVAPPPPVEPAAPVTEEPAESVPTEDEAEAEPAPEAMAVREAEPAAEEEIAETPREDEAVVQAAEVEPAPEPSLDDEIRAQNEVQLVSFFLADQEFTIPINAVQEVVRYMEPTAVPESHAFLAGIVNMRGRVTPVLRLGVILGKEEPPADDQTPGDEDENKRRFLIVCRKGDVQVALLVERVHTMYRVPQSAIEWNIEQRMGADVEIVRGLLRLGDGLVGIVSLERMLDKVGMQGGLGG
ncbi:MAG: chemotaxis protein CheW [Oceanidesulfovibrio sp.]